MTPEAWKKVTIKVILNKGEAARPENHRPICTLSILYNVFSTLLYNRLKSKLDRRQPSHWEGVEGFVAHFKNLDHISKKRSKTMKGVEQSAAQTMDMTKTAAFY